MTDHLPFATLNSLADGELSPEQLAGVQQHLAQCSACTTSALHQSLLKSAIAKAGQRYAAPQHLVDRLELYRHVAQRHDVIPKAGLLSGLFARSQSKAVSQNKAIYGWAAAAAILVVLLSSVFIQRRLNETASLLAQQASLVAEVTDQHIATLASSQPLAVLSSDKHTVKPWFQGKLPFSFNLPEDLPADTRLQGANLTYLRNQPVAQLLYSVGKHRVSVFVEQTPDGRDSSKFSANSSGFHLMTATTDGLQLEAISDVDPARLSQLLDIIQRAQTATASASR